MESAGIAELWWPQNRKYTIGVVATLVAIIVLVITLSCGGSEGLWKHCLDVFFFPNTLESLAVPRLKQAPDRILIQVFMSDVNKGKELGAGIREEVYHYLHLQVNAYKLSDQSTFGGNRVKKCWV